MLYDHDYQPIWQQPMPEPFPLQFRGVVETADSSLVFLYSGINYTAVKISRTGEMLWGPEGSSFTSISGFGTDAAIEPDLQGGVFLFWKGSNYLGQHATIQHLDSAGNITMQEGGVVLDSSQEANSLELMILPDSSVLVCWSVLNEVRINRVDSLAQSLWNQPISIITSYASPRANLCDFGAQSFAVIVENGSSLDLHRFSSSGMAMWTGPVSVMSAGINNVIFPKAKLAPDGSIYVAANIWLEIVLQKVSPDGALQFPEGVHLSEWLGYIDSCSNIVVDDLGNCTIIVSSSQTEMGFDNVNACKISPAGAVSIHPITNISARNERPTAHAFGDHIHVAWQNWGTNSCGIYVQILDSQMQNLLSENGMALKVGSSGIVHEIQTAVIETGSYVLWKEATLNDVKWRLILQRYTNWGQPMLGAQGRQINSPGSRVVGSAKVLSNGSNLILLWYEILGQDPSTRMQIIDQNGNFLMGEWGVVINTNGPSYGNFSVSSYMGDWYVLWTSGGSIMGQKIRGTQNLWGDGLQLTQPDPQNPGNLQYMELSMPWLFWKVNWVRYFKRIDTDGVTIPGFPDYGMTMPSLGDENDVNRAVYTVCGDYIHIFLRMGSDQFTTRHAFINPQGDLLFDSVNLGVYGAYQILAHNNEIWITSHVNEDYNVRKYDTSGNLLMNQTITIPLPSGHWFSHWHHILSNGEHLLLVKSTGTYNHLRHMYLSETWNLITPADDLLSNIHEYMMFPPAVSRLGDRTWIDWYNAEDYTRDYHVGISLQRLVRDGVALPETEAQTPTKPLLTGCSPNPFNPSASISFQLPQAGNTRLAVYDLKGRKLRELVNGDLPAGEHSMLWDGTCSDGQDAASGVYILRLESGSGTHSRRITLMK